MEDAQESPGPGLHCGLRTPHHSSMEGGHKPGFGGFSGLTNASISGRGMDSGLSGAPTALRKSSGEIDSPAVRKSSEHVERRVPSCPQKEGSKVHKRHSLNPSNPYDDRETEEIRPRMLDMSDADPLNGLSLSPMNMSSTPTHAPMEANSSKFALQSMRPPQPDVDRNKRMRLSIMDHPIEGLTLDEQLNAEAIGGGRPAEVHTTSARFSGSSRSSNGSVSDGGFSLARVSNGSGSDGGFSLARVSDGGFSCAGSFSCAGGGEGLMRPPPRFQKQNSMADTKMLFMRKDMHSCSYSASPGTAGAFQFDDHFEWLHKLGSGSFAEVYAVRHKMRPDERYAIKRSKHELHSRKQRAEYLREVQLANDMPAHANVVGYYRAWQDSFFFYVQMELCENGTLAQLMEREGAILRAPESEGRVWEMVRHIARGLAHIHSREVLHCDLKPGESSTPPRPLLLSSLCHSVAPSLLQSLSPPLPYPTPLPPPLTDNILISRDGVFKIGDLGQAIALASWNEQDGDARYLSRDLLEANPSTAADIFSFGIMLFEV